MENKNKKNVKKTTNKKVNTNKKVAAHNNKPVKKVNAEKPANTKKKVAPKAAPKKTAPAKKAQPAKKVQPAKAPAKKVQSKPVVKKAAPEVKKEVTKEEKLERTMIFDGTQKKNLEEVVNKIGEDKVVLKDKVIKRRPINRYIIYVLSVLILVTLVGSIIAINKESKKNNKNTEPDSFERLNAADYQRNDGSEIRNTARDTIKDEDVDIKYSNLKTITIDEFSVKVAEGEKMLVMISSETCSFSILAENDYNRVLSEEKRLMYRLDITAMTDEENARLRNYYPYTATPTVIAVKDGEIVSEVEGTQTEAEFRNWVRSNN